MIRIALILAGLLIVSTARAAIGTYAVECTAQCVASDGTTQPAGTFVNVIVVDPTKNTPPAGYAWIAFAGQTIYQPASPAGQPIAFKQWLGLLTSAQRTGLWSKMVSDTGFTDAWWSFLAVVVASNGTVDPTQPAYIALVNYCVTAGYLTSAQGTALLALQPG